MTCLYQLMFISLCLINIGQADYNLVLAPSNLAVGITEDITLGCSFRGQESSSAFSSISRLRILKETWPDNFVIITEVMEDQSVSHNTGLSWSAIATGHIGNVSSSFIQIYWTLATSNIFGIYRCDIIGFKPNGDVLVEKTPIVVAVESEVTVHDALDRSIKQKAYIQQKIADQNVYCDNEVTAVEYNVTVKILESEISQNSSSQEFQQSYQSQLANLSVSINRLKNTGVFQYWPEGSYGLLMPDSGCPNNVGAQWAKGYRRFHTESTDRNYDSVVNLTHLPNPTIERIETDNFMYQYFCVSKERSPGPAWPKGSYCINRVGGGCPTGFSSGFITWQDEITNSKASISGILPDGDYQANLTSIYYCCRSDGSPDQLVYLPKVKPFFLYRYSGKCQAIAEMTLSSGDMTFDTDNGKGDTYENNYHPDGSVDNVRIELCYYS
jgi:hypothetical protein